MYTPHAHIKHVVVQDLDVLKLSGGNIIIEGFIIIGKAAFIYLFTYIYMTANATP
jgi:hypothetical protein